MERFDAAVIGGGLLGCFAARALSRRKLDCVLLEAREDVCTGISRANTAVVYSGYDHKPGTQKAEMTVRANKSFSQLCEELDVPFSRCGSLMLSFGGQADDALNRKFQQGKENGVPGLQMLSAAEVYRVEPDLADGIHSALWSPTTGTVNPWQLGIAACENALQNGTELRLNTRVGSIHAEGSGFRLETERGDCFVRGVLNCAGLAAARVQEMLFPCPVQIVPTAGDYLVLDRTALPLPAHILEYEPERKGKGLTFVPTVEGSLLVGPLERDPVIPYATSEEGLRCVWELAQRVLPGLDAGNIIRSFAAVRPNPQTRDGGSIHSFVIEHPAQGFWSLIGIKTPGMTCASELGSTLAEQLASELNAENNPKYNPVRRGIRGVRGLSFEERKSLVKTDADYGEILCYCEDVTKAEVLEAIRRGAVTLDGIKRRTGIGMGPCQGARCQQAVAELLAKELGRPESRICKDGPGSEFVREKR